MACILQRGQGGAPAYPTRRPQRCPWKATSGHRTDARIRSTHGYADAGTEISPQKLRGGGIYPVPDARGPCGSTPRGATGLSLFDDRRRATPVCDHTGCPADDR